MSAFEAPPRPGLTVRLRTRLGASESLRLGAASGAIVVARVMGTAATFAYTLLMARLMSPEDFGLVWTIWSGSFIAATLATLNLGAVAIRQVVQARGAGRDDEAAGFVTFCRAVLAALSPFVMAGFLALIWWRHPEVVAEHPVAVLLASLAIPLMGWQQTNTAQAVALHLPARAQIPRELARPILFLGAMSLAWALNRSMGVEGTIGLYLLAVILAVGIQFALIRHAFEFLKGTRRSWAGWRGWVASGVLLAPSRLLADQLKNVLMLVASLGVGALGVAHLNVALSVVNFLNFAVTAVEMGFASRISAAVVQRQDARAVRLLAASNLLKAAPILALAVVFVTFMEPIVGLFGPGYEESATAALWFMLIPLAKAAFGNSAMILQVRGHQRAILATSLLALLALALSAPLLSLTPAELRVTRAAQAFSAILALMYAAQWVLCLRRTGFDTSLPGSLLRQRRAAKGTAP